MRKQRLSADIATRKADLRLFVERVEVDDAEERLFGSKGALEFGALSGTWPSQRAGAQFCSGVTRQSTAAPSS